MRWFKIWDPFVVGFLWRIMVKGGEYIYILWYIDIVILLHATVTKVDSDSQISKFKTGQGRLTSYPQIHWVELRTIIVLIKLPIFSGWNHHACPLGSMVFWKILIVLTTVRYLLFHLYPIWEAAAAARARPLIAMDMKQYTFPFHAHHITIPMKFHGGNANNMVRNMG